MSALGRCSTALIGCPSAGTRPLSARLKTAAGSERIARALTVSHAKKSLDSSAP